MRVPNLTVNLTTTAFRSNVIEIPQDATRLAAMVTHDDATYSWTTGVLTLQWTVDPDYRTWVDFDPAVTLTSSEIGTPRVSVAGVLAVRWRTTTADGGADPSATLDYLIT